MNRNLNLIFNFGYDIFKEARNIINE